MSVEDEEWAGGAWGHCQHCRFFGASGAEAPGRLAERRCHQSELMPFDLVVTGSCGCNHFEKAAGLSEDVEEPTEQPSLH